MGLGPAPGNPSGQGRAKFWTGGLDELFGEANENCAALCQASTIADYAQVTIP
jgi:hypothetical protein